MSDFWFMQMPFHSEQKSKINANKKWMREKKNTQWNKTHKESREKRKMKTKGKHCLFIYLWQSYVYSTSLEGWNITNTLHQPFRSILYEYSSLVVALLCALIAHTHNIHWTVFKVENVCVADRNSMKNGIPSYYWLYNETMCLFAFFGNFNYKLNNRNMCITVQMAKFLCI